MERTEADEKAYDALETYVKTNGYPPTMRELGDILGMAPSSVHARLHRLVELGAIELVTPSRAAIVLKGWG